MVRRLAKHFPPAFLFAGGFLLTAVACAAAAWALGAWPVPDGRAAVGELAGNTAGASTSDSQPGIANTDVGDRVGHEAEPIHVGRLTGVDLDGEVHRLGESHGCRAVVVVFLSTDCPIANGYIPTLNRIARDFRDIGAEFFGVISSRSVSRAEAVEHRREFRIGFPVLFDASQSLARSLEPTHTPEAFVLDRRGAIAYRGAIDDRYADLGRRKPTPDRDYLLDAIDAVLTDEPVAIARTTPVGCLFEDVPAVVDAADVTYARDVAPLIQTECVVCHRAGAVAPFPLTSYSDVKRRAKQIRLVLERRIMPPWKPDEDFGRFRNERRLADGEIALFGRWVDAGAPEGDAAESPPPLEFTDGWELGRPDVVLTVREPFTVPADGADVYQYFVIPTGLEAYHLVRAIEYRSGNPRVVHHASFRWDRSGEARRLDAADPSPGYRRFGGWGFSGGGLGGWALGVGARRFANGMGRVLPAEADFVVQTHYHPSGKPETDQAQIGLYLAPLHSGRAVAELAVANFDLKIPAGVRSFKHVANYTLPVDADVHTVTPHMHLLGRRAVATATRPDGSVEPLIRISDWDFNWQSVYEYRERVRLPAGTEIRFEVVYDNSRDNAVNPHVPPRDVRWGEESTDEMAVLFLDVTAVRVEEQEALVEHNGAYLNRGVEEHLAPLLGDEERRSGL